MARIDWNMFKERTDAQQEAANRATNGSKVGYFSLKDDGEEAIVRIMHDTPEDFDLMVVHRLPVGDGKFRPFNCLRSPKDPIDVCPVCSAGGKPEYKIYIHLIEYVRGEDGSIKPVAKVWERSSAYARKLAGLMNEYGSLSDCIFKIVRHGAKGSMKTEYDILFGSEKVYPASVYVKDESLFEEYSALGTMVADKSYEELLSMDLSSVGNKNTDATTYSAPVATNQPTYNRPAQAVPTYETPVPTQREATPTYENRPIRRSYDPTPEQTAPARNRYSFN